MQRQLFLRVLARSFLAGEQTVEELVARGSHILGKPWSWLRPLARRYVKAFGDGPGLRPRFRDAVVFFVHDRGLQQVWSKHLRELSIEHWLTEPQQMQPVAAAEMWGVPAIESVGALADWLNLAPGELQWFADLKGLGYKKSSLQLRHYHYRILSKPSGDIRLIEAPKQRLKELQQRILSQILNKIPPHPATHGFLKRRSIKTFVAPHVGQRVILRMDLRDFFPSFAAARIQTLFRTMGYPEAVADLLGGICTNATPRDVWHKDVWRKHANDAGSEDFPAAAQRNILWEAWGEARAFYAKPHLPQGAPTSPALANLCSYRMDCRLTGMAKSAGASYTRYADDLAFSGDAQFEQRVERFATHVAAILLEEGFTVNHRKTRIMRQGVRQHLAGIVANEHMNVRRSDFDHLKAILTNCIRLGPESQNREAHPRFRAHLEGRVGFVEMINSAKGKRLRKIFEQVQWG